MSRTMQQQTRMMPGSVKRFSDNIMRKIRGQA